MIFYFHLGFVISSAIIVLFADHEGFNWFSGRKEMLNLSTLRRYHYLLWLGLVGVVSTGILLFSSRLYLLREPLFIIKLLFVAILLTNAFLIGRLLPVATLRSYSSLSFAERMPLIAAGTISGVSWVSTVSVAFYLFGLAPFLT